MADGALFIGWGRVVRGREHEALSVFNEDMQFYAELQQKKEIESFEIVLLEAHGGDLSGFVLVKGDPEPLARLRTDPEFRRRMIRAALYVDDLGVVGALIGGGVATGMAAYLEEVSKIKSPVPA
jgi:hypothetical protein